MSQARFQKQQREKARRERAAAKFAKKVERDNAPAPDSESDEPQRDQAVVLADLADLHERFEAGKMSFEDFEDAKQQLTEQLDVR